MTGIDLKSLRTVHVQRSDVRNSTKVTRDHHDHHVVDITEHFSERVDVSVKGPPSRLLVPVGYCDHRGRGRVIVPGKEGCRDLPLLRGGAVTNSGLFALPWVASNTNGSPVFNLLSTHLRYAMFTNSITPNFDDTIAHCGYAQAGGQYSANEVSGSGYTAGGAGDANTTGHFGTSGGPTSSSPTYVNTAGLIAFSDSTVIWPTATITNARCVLIYDNSLTNKTGFILVTFGSDYSTSGGTFTIQWAAGGIWTWQAHS